MKIFLDTADVEAIRRANDTGLLDGITTNPMKVAETGKNFYSVIEEICSIVSGPVSAEAVAHSAEDIVVEAEKLAEEEARLVSRVRRELLQRAENAKSALGKLPRGRRSTGKED